VPESAGPAGVDLQRWLEEAEVAIVGLGLMGGSLAAALRGGGSFPRRCRRVVGIVRRPDAAVAAASWVDAVTTDLGALASADIVVLATPVRIILELLPTAAAIMRPGALLTDLGSTKDRIVRVMSSLPGEVAVAGGHPMCGKEAGGLAAADAALFAGAPYILCPVPGRPPLAIERLRHLAARLGARPRVLDAPAHDRLVAAVSHVPYLSAVSLVLAAEQLATVAGPAVWEIAAGGFRDTTRVAAGETEMWRDILLTNSAEVLAQLDRLSTTLLSLREAIGSADAERLAALITDAQHRRRTLFQ